ncbi:MAG: hypothetical protein NTZ19_00715 [Bacteroidetes bacterium]|nr:hypothetical protein [Bacteroidota bacterium]
MQTIFKGAIKKENAPSSIYRGSLDNPKKVNDSSSFANQILLNGITAEQLVELFRPMIREEVRFVMSEQEERLISPAEACKLFKPAITKATLASWTDKGLLQDHRIGGRVYYRQSEILKSTLTLSKYKSLSGKIFA